MQWLMAPLRFVNQVPQTVASLSLAARIAALVGLFQVVVVLLAIGVLLVGGERQVFQAWWRPGKLAMLAVLLLLTPALVHQAARLWLERDASRWPDILAAWNAALAELRRQGIVLADVPLFLVVGSASDEQEEQLFADPPVELPVQASPAGAAALHVYGGPEAVFICLATACQSSDVARRGGARGTARAAVPQPQAVVAADDVRGTVAVALPAETDPEPRAAVAAPAAPAASAGGYDVNATIQIDAIAPEAAAGAVVAAVRAPVLSPAEREGMSQRLKYVCELVRRERGGLAPLNGVLALVPAPLLRADGGNAQALGRALGDDLAGIRQGMGLRAPVTVLVAGMEEDKGFAELIRRMPASERQSRLGQRFPIGAAPSYDQLGTVASRACGMVEDLILGRLLRAKAVLDESGNRDLVGLVARLRSEWAGRLTVLLRRAFTAVDGESTDVLPLLSGCYLAACGAAADRRGFVRGVFEKVLDAQGDIEWTEQAEAADRALGRAARALWIVSGVVLAGLAAALVWRMIRG
jgi:hypothetical protein